MRLGEIRSIATHLIIGLGNPGTRYEWTRHNVGFMVLDQVAEECGVLFQRDVGFLIGDGMVADEHAILVKPQTFMNNSGDVVTALYKETISSPSDLVVIHDDLDLDLGTLLFFSMKGNRICDNHFLKLVRAESVKGCT